jgi:DNA-binding MurR/RpiR family transcriptional regulator
MIGYTLAKVHPDVVTLTHGGSREYDPFRTVPGVSWVVALAFPRYPRETLELLDYVREEGLSVGVITDSMLSPVAKRADVTLAAPADPVSFVDSYCAPQALNAAVLVEYDLRARERTKASLARFERIASRRSIFHAGR